ncbi:type II toxin-antitoxin system Phd/YefM family antitoxin [Streptomyces gobiensis]|uniref:type II toxin-antitoxin system Phd/YefM family antitoxin n=1 Tax=Streptomyces gobiensis TaxID=2875706 RepID=UPI001E537ED3|nr:type II toxin-antitoxin system prevent-host-death family antitoxin [Streptomyces gobiensis]UGY91117.1 type II toxin-antitoxin system prevent-host-death family antitoxin [Streptomyces gobiensis]
MSITASEARKRLFPLIEEVNDDATAVEIVSRAGTAYLVPAEEYESLKETAYLLRSPANAERLLRAVRDVATGNYEYRDLIPVEGEESGE